MKSFLVIGLLVFILLLSSLVISNTGVHLTGGQFYQTNNTIYINPCGFIYLVDNTIYAFSSNQLFEIYQNTTSTFSKPFIVLYNNLVTTTIPVNETYLFVNGNVGFIIDSRELLILCKTSLISITILPFKNFYFEGDIFLVSFNNSIIPINGKMPQVYLWNGTLYEDGTILGIYQDNLFFGIINSTTVLGKLSNTTIEIDYYSSQKLVRSVTFTKIIGFLGVDIWLGGSTIYNPLFQEFYRISNLSFLNIDFLATYPIPINPTLAVCSNGKLITTSYTIISVFSTTSSSFTTTPTTSSSSTVMSTLPSTNITVYSTVTQTYTTTIVPSSKIVSSPTLIGNEFITIILLIIIVILVILLIRSKRNSK
jgi:hypothetical protein